MSQCGESRKLIPDSLQKGFWRLDSCSKNASGKMELYLDDVPPVTRDVVSAVSIVFFIKYCTSISWYIEISLVFGAFHRGAV